MLGREVVLVVGLLLGRLVFFCPFFWIRRVFLFSPSLGALAVVVGNEVLAVASELAVVPRFSGRRRPPFRHALLNCPPYTPLQQASIVV